MNSKKAKRFRVDDFICIESVKNLLSRHPLLVPFDDTLQRNGKRFTDLLRSIPNHITLTLNDLFNDYERKGGFLSVWKAYQYEVANEVFWRGKPTAGMDNTYAINLGPGGAFPSRSLTWERGFLALEDSTVCALNDRSLPPLNFWHLSDNDKNRIQRICNFSDFLGDSKRITGMRAVLILLQDILHDPRRNAECDISLLADLRRKEMPAWAKLVGAINLDCLCEKIMKKPAYKTPYVFGRVLQMLEEHNIDIKEALISGFHQLKIVYFPDLRTFDNNRNPRMHWSGRGVLKLIDNARPSLSIEETAKRLTVDVIWFLEENQLVYKSKFAEYFQSIDNFVFPWICDLLERLNEWPMEEEVYVRVYAYLSCIALLQNAWFVHFQNLECLHKNLVQRFPSFIERLQKSQVLSFFSLPKLNHCHLKRLHESIPISLLELNSYRALDIESPTSFSDHEDMESEDKIEDVPVVITIEEEKVLKAKRKHLPGGFKARWSQQEMELMDHIISVNFRDVKSAYMEYLKQTEANSLQNRSFPSFKMKYMRIRQELKKA